MTAADLADSNDTSDTVPRSVERVLDLLEFVVTSGSTNLSDAAAATDLTPTTALRYLRALDARGYVSRDDTGRYSSGPTLARLVTTDGRADLVARLVAVAQPVLDDLAARTGESVYLAVADDTVARYVATAASPRAIRHVGWVGQEVPVDGSAVGDAFDDPHVAHSRTGAVEPDITAVSQAVPTGTDLQVAISIVGPAHRLDPAARDAAADALATATDTVARRLRVVPGTSRNSDARPPTN